MLFSFDLKSSFLLIFFVHGAVFSIVLLIKGLKTGNKSSLWLSLFTFLCALYIAPFMLGYAGWYARQPYRDILFYIPFQQLFLLPPVLYFYIRTLLDKSFHFARKDYWHFAPAILYFCYCLVMVLNDQVFSNTFQFYADGRDKDFSSWYQISGVIFMAFYLTQSLRIYNQYRSISYNVLSFADQAMFRWAKRYLWAFLILIGIRLIFFVINPEWDEFGRKFWYYLSFSLLFYYVSISGFANTLLTTSPFKDVPLDFEKDKEFEKETMISKSAETDGHEKQDIHDLAAWKDKVEALMLKEKLFENPALMLTDLSMKLDTNSKTISQVINQGFNMNFNDFVNHYRVNAIRSKIEAGEHQVKTLLGLALECGFNSKSTFNRAFKRATNLTPKEYIEKQPSK
ncbi:MAG TPA: helix-turn-helix domain-containing protein [Roseivirga sp.]